MVAQFLLVLFEPICHFWPEAGTLPYFLHHHRLVAAPSRQVRHHDAEQGGDDKYVTVADWLGLAVCVGIGPTKTLVKLANHCAKKKLAGNAGVCDFTTMSTAERLALFERIDVGEVWGVGRKISARLESMGIATVRQLHDADAETLRQQFSVVLERTVREIRGVSCLDLEEVVPDKQQIMSSRSFGTLVYERTELEEAVASYIARAAEKLRAQDALAGALQVYIRTNIFKPEVPQYQWAMTIPLPEASADTRVLTQWGIAIGIFGIATEVSAAADDGKLVKQTGAITP